MQKFKSQSQEVRSQFDFLSKTFKRNQERSCRKIRKFCGLCSWNWDDNRRNLSGVAFPKWVFKISTFILDFTLKVYSSYTGETYSWSFSWWNEKSCTPKIVEKLSLHIGDLTGFVAWFPGDQKVSDLALIDYLAALPFFGVSTSSAELLIARE